MSINKKIKLNSNDINSLIKSLQKLSKDINNLSNDVTKELAQKGLTELNKYYATTPSDPNIQDINTNIEKTFTGYRIVSSGTDVLYAEFGTGDKGEADKHKDKSKYNLNRYNSGKYIRKVREGNQELAKHGITSGKYWTYKKKGGNVEYTQGIPSGKQMYKTSDYLRKNYKKIAKEKVSDVLSKV